MIEIKIQLGNDGARAAQREIKSFLNFVTEKVAGDKYDRRDTATGAYVALRLILECINREVARQEGEKAKGAQPPAPRQPTIRELRGR